MSEQFSVLTLVSGEPLRGSDALDRPVDAVCAQDADVGASVATGAEVSVFLTVDAASVGEARRQAAEAVRAALAEAGEARREAVPSDVYDTDGRLRS